MAGTLQTVPAAGARTLPEGEVLLQDDAIDEGEREGHGDRRACPVCSCESGSRRVARADVVPEALQHGHLVRRDGTGVVGEDAELEQRACADGVAVDGFELFQRTVLLPGLPKPGCVHRHDKS